MILAPEREPDALAALATSCAVALSEMGLPSNLSRDEAVQVFFWQVCNIMAKKEQTHGEPTTQATTAPVGDRD